MAKSTTAAGRARCRKPAPGLEVGSGQAAQALCAGPPPSGWSSKLCGHPCLAHVTDRPLRKRVGTALRTEPPAEQSSMELRPLFLAPHKGHPRHFWGHQALLATRPLCPRGLCGSLHQRTHCNGLPRVVPAEPQPTGWRERQRENRLATPSPATRRKRKAAFAGICFPGNSCLREWKPPQTRVCFRLSETARHG